VNLNLASLPFDGVAGLLRDVLDRFVADPKDKAAAIEAAQSRAFELATRGTFAERAELEQSAGQVATNQAEATSPSLLVAGWRPAVGWICASGFAMQFVISPMAEWLAALAGHPVKFPVLDMGTMLTLLGGMLGLGSLRTVEKVKGVA